MHTVPHKLMLTVTYDVDNLFTKTGTYSCLEDSERSHIKGYDFFRHCLTENVSENTVMHDVAPPNRV